MILLSSSIRNSLEEVIQLFYKNFDRFFIPTESDWFLRFLDRKKFSILTYTSPSQNSLNKSWERRTFSFILTSVSLTSGMLINYLKKTIADSQK